jgi:hypothetical protein
MFCDTRRGLTGDPRTMLNVQCVYTIYSVTAHVRAAMSTKPSAGSLLQCSPRSNFSNTKQKPQFGKYF